MLKQHLLITLLLSAFLQVYAQKYDSQWPFGYGHNIPLSFGISLLDFNNGQVSIAPFAETDPHLGNSGSFICDKNGKLMLMTNNCEVYDRNFQVVSGSDTLTPGITYNNYCPDYQNYPANQSSLFLPALDNDSTTYLLHKDSEISSALQDVVTRRFFLSIIVQKQDGTFYLKEKRQLLAANMVVNRLSACLHEDGIRWWTWVAGYNSNKFYKYLIGGPAVVEGPFVQEIGPALLGAQIGIGQVAYSSNGQVLGMNNDAYGALLYDFDNATGILSNWRSILYPNPTGQSAEGLAFSLDNRFLYLTAGRDLYQMDLQDPDPAGSTVHLAHLNLADETGWPIGVGLMYTGPDCRIYVGPGTTTTYIHVIHSPNQKGAACQFEANAIRTPTNLDFDFPNLPTYRFNGQCDSTIMFGILGSNASLPSNALRLFPNPASDGITLSLPAGHTYRKLSIIDMYGHEALHLQISEGQTTESIPTTQLLPGVYFLIPNGEKAAALKFIVSQ